MNTPQPDACRSCKAPIYWAHMETGGFMPVDMEPTPEGEVALSMRGDEIVGRVVKAGSAPKLRATHFATCPHATSWRKHR